jgi:hypothetical protein
LSTKSPFKNNISSPSPKKEPDHPDVGENLANKFAKLAEQLHDSCGQVNKLPQLLSSCPAMDGGSAQSNSKIPGARDKRANQATKLDSFLLWL